jgi:diguanylate cyclase (GGDEF)-like protein
VNDTQGHAAGDAVLCAVAMVLGGVRGEDSAFRLGGDEFAVLLVGATTDEAGRVMTRLARDVERDAGSRGVSMSWGVAALPGVEPELLVERADAALYESKRRGAAVSWRAAAKGNGHWERRVSQPG